MSHSHAGQPALTYRHIPKVPGTPLLGNLRALQRDPFRFQMEAMLTWGDIMRFSFLRDEVVFIAHPDDIQHVLQNTGRLYDKQTFDYQLLYPLVGQGLLTSDGDFWLRQRRLAQPAFHRKRIMGFADMIVEMTQAMIDSWQPAIDRGEAIALDQEMMRLTLTIVGRALLSIDLGDEASVFGQAFKQANARFGYDNILSILLPWLPTGPNRRFKQAIATMDAIVAEILADRRRNPEAHEDLLMMLMAARDQETGEGMSDRQLIDEIKTILLAGHETTANALTWTLYLLSQHPEAREELEAEVDRRLDGRTPHADDLEYLSFNRMVLQEGMRLYPPAWALARRAVAPDVLSGYAIPAGTVINFNLYVTHRHPHFWNDAEIFKPQRFAQEESQTRHTYAYLPFGGGPRKCIGEPLAMLEGQLILAHLISQLQLDLAPDQKVAKLPLITLTPKYGMRMVPRYRNRRH